MSLDETLQHAFLSLQKHDFAEARRLMADVQDVPSINVFLLRGLAEIGGEDWACAAKTFRAATNAFPDHAPFWFNRGVAEESLGDDGAACASFSQSLTLAPRQAEALGNLSNILCRLGNAIDAEDHARAALDCGIPRGQGLNSLGLALARQGRLAAAEKTLAEAAALAPDDPLIALNRANLLVDQRHFPEAWPLFAEARRLNPRPEIRRDEGMARLLVGDDKGGWPLYEARLELPKALHVPCSLPRFVPEDAKPQRILILSEQGFGDTIQFCRYGALLAAQGHELFWMVQPDLVRLLNGQIPGHVLQRDAPPPQADSYLPLMSLPLATGFPLIPTAPLWRAPQGPDLPCANGKRKIGVVWAGSKTHRRDGERSIPFDVLAPLWALQDAAFYAPFRGDALTSLGTTPIQKLDSLLIDFADTAALLAQLDVLISVDTAVAHLAGSLGVRTFLLLPYTPDWRWGTEGTTTPWYKSLTLYRAPAPHTWSDVMESVVQALNEAPI